MESADFSSEDKAKEHREETFAKLPNFLETAGKNLSDEYSMRKAGVQSACAKLANFLEAAGISEARI